MITAQNYAVRDSRANAPELAAIPFPQTRSLPLVSTGPFYAQIEALQNLYLLTKNHHAVATSGGLLEHEIRELSLKLDQALNQLDPDLLDLISYYNLHK